MLKKIIKKLDKNKILVYYLSRALTRCFAVLD